MKILTFTSLQGLLSNKKLSARKKLFFLHCAPESYITTFLSTRKIRGKIPKYDLRCAMASCACEPILVETCDVRVCGAFLGLRSAIAALHIFLAIMQDMKIECPFFWCNLQFYNSKIEDFSN